MAARVYLSDREGRPFTLGRCLLDKLGTRENQLSATLTFTNTAVVCLSRTEGGGLPLAHSPICPCRAFCALYRVNFQHSAKVELCIQGLIESLDGLFLIARQELHLMQYPKAWGTPGAPLGPGEAMEQVCARKLENVGIKLTATEGKLWYQQSLCELMPFYMCENTFPVRLDFGLPVIQQLQVFLHIKIPATARSLRLTTKAEVDIALWLSPEQLREIEEGQLGTAEGVWRGNKSCKVSYLQLAGSSPNSVGEGWAMPSLAALQQWLLCRGSLV